MGHWRFKGGGNLYKYLSYFIQIAPLFVENSRFLATDLSYLYSLPLLPSPSILTAPSLHLAHNTCTHSTLWPNPLPSRSCWVVSILRGVCARWNARTTRLAVQRPPPSTYPFPTAQVGDDCRPYVHLPTPPTPPAPGPPHRVTKSNAAWQSCC